MQRIAVVGAGMTGLTALHCLSGHALDVQVFDKGRRRGGRIATRRTPHGVFDQGAPQINANDAEFNQFLDGLGAVSGATGVRFGTPGMRSIFDRFEEYGNLLQEVRINGITRDAEGWSLSGTSNRAFHHFDAVVVTVPAPQAADLVKMVDASLAARLSDVRMQPVWTCMVTFKDAIPDFDVPEGGAILRADHMGRKPERQDPREAWVIHMTPAFSEENLETDATTMASLILDLFSEECGIVLPEVCQLNAHRWRYAFADAPLGEPFLQATQPGLFVGGDWTLGRTAEDAFNSGRAMAQSVLSYIATRV